MIHQAEMIVGVGVPWPVDLKRAGGLAAVGVAQIRKYATEFALELFDRIERAGDQTLHPRIQCAASDEQQRKAGTNLSIADSRGAFFIKAHGGASRPGLLSERIRRRSDCCRGGAGCKC